MSFFNNPRDFIITRRLNVGERLEVGHHAHFHGHLSVKDYIRTYKDALVHGSLTVDNDTNIGQDLTVGGTTTLEGNTIITNTDDSTQPSNGSLVVAGGVGIEKTLRTNSDVYAGGKVYQESYLLLPPGTVISYAGSTSPDGFLSCDGSAVSRTTYAGLFAIIGTTYGNGNGSTTFNLPDLRQKMVFGVSSSNSLGTSGGSQSATLTTNELPAHTHTGTATSAGAHSHSISDPGHSHGVGIGKDDGNLSHNTGQYPPGDSNSADYNINSTSSTTGISVQSAGAHTHNLSINSTGNGNSFSIMNPYLSLNFIIKH